MSSADAWSEGEVELIWCRVDLDQVARLVDNYELWKDSPWYHAVDWLRVVDLLDGVLQDHCRDGVVDERLEQVLGPVAHTLSRTDHEGLVALIRDPVEITRDQIHNGGHRSKAIRLQGVRLVPGRCVRGDVGSGVDARQVYPIQDADRGGHS